MPDHGEGPDTTSASQTQWTLSASARKPVPDLVQDRVVRLIDSGELAVGDRLPTEPELARLLGVARSSVRTALQRLQARGVLEVNRGRGWFVSSTAPASRQLPDALTGPDFDLLEVMEVRISLEAAAVALAATRLSSSDCDEIAKLSRDHRDAQHDKAESLLATDEAFHRAIVAGTGNTYLLALYDSLTPLMADWRSRSFTTQEIHRRSARDHDQIVWQLRRGDEMGARLAMTGHLLGQYDVIESESRTRGSRPEHGRPNLATFVDDDSDRR
jgi:DNA-binding FadR family transcriptional regulator